VPGQKSCAKRAQRYLLSLECVSVSVLYCHMLCRVMRLAVWCSGEKEDLLPSCVVLFVLYVGSGQDGSDGASIN
jgi:hypothetical protein